MSTQTKPELTIENVPKLLDTSPKAKADFFDAFWTTWSFNGFGTLTKKDTELLIFCCLKRAFGTSGPQNNYAWARLLRLTPTKIKAMRLEAHLRFGHLFGESSGSDMKQFLQSFNKLHGIELNGLETTGDITDVTVGFVVEDPVIQMEIDHRLKLIGSYLDFRRNREVITIGLTSFFLILADEEQKNAINGWVAKKAKEASYTDALKTRVTAAEYANKSEGDKLLTFVEDLAEVAQVKQLVNHLKKIIASQLECKK